MKSPTINLKEAGSDIIASKALQSSVSSVELQVLLYMLAIMSCFCEVRHLQHSNCYTLQTKLLLRFTR